MSSPCSRSNSSSSSESSAPPSPAAGNGPLPLAVPRIQRSTSVPPDIDTAIESGDNHSVFDGDSHTSGHSHVHASQPVPNDELALFSASTASGRRNSNTRLQHFAPPPLLPSSPPAVVLSGTCLPPSPASAASCMPQPPPPSPFVHSQNVVFDTLLGPPPPSPLCPAPPNTPLPTSLAPPLPTSAINQPDFIEDTLDLPLPPLPPADARAAPLPPFPHTNSHVTYSHSDNSDDEHEVDEADAPTIDVDDGSSEPDLLSPVASVSSVDELSSPVASMCVSVSGGTSPMSQVILQRSKLGRMTIMERDPNKINNQLQASNNKVEPSPANPSSSSTPSTCTSNPPVSSSSSSTASSFPSASNPSTNVLEVQRVQHVTYDVNTGVYSGLPKEWEDALKQQFGLPAHLIQSIKLNDYPARIPLILVKLERFIKLHGGLDIVGVFRLAPDQKECENLKSALNSDLNWLDSHTVNDLNCCATLIKQWFRDLPSPLLAAIDTKQLQSITAPEQVPRILGSLPQPQHAIFLWLLDLCCDVTARSPHNKMVAKNMSICVSPNLYRFDDKSSKDPSDTLKTLALVKCYTQFVEVAIGWREAQRGQPVTATSY